MKKIKLYQWLTVIVFIALYSCQEEGITDGYLSNDIRYETNPFVVRQGEIRSSPPLSVYGSTAPVEVELLDIRRVGSEETAEAWLQDYPTPIWVGAMDPEVDTTLAAILENKIETRDLPVFRIEEIGGRIMISSQTWNVEPGEYTIDVRVSNSAGSRVVEDATTIIVEQGQDYRLGFQESFFTSVNQPQGWIWRPLEVEVNFDPSGSNKIILKWMDKNGDFFNPSEGEVINGWTEGWRHYFQENTPWGYELTDEAMIFEFPYPPFPSNPQAWVYSYRIPSQFISEYGEEWFADMDFNTRLHDIRVYKDGTYTFIIKCNDIERRDPNAPDPIVEESEVEGE
ncbi:hypothetical protein [Zunongwangia mangrovi]|nr:hypothetical protein [Zunongwangia mangrovi]